MKSTRVTPRFAFTAPARIFRDGGVATGATVRELSQNGCFLEFSEPYPPGTTILLRIFSHDEFFEADAKVIYAKPGLGMAVAFLNVKPPFLHVLEKWSSAAMRKVRGETSIT
jgi:PilZ domain